MTDGCDCTACTIRRRPISPNATPANRACWQRLEAAGWKATRRGGTGSWWHHDRPHTMCSTAAALMILDGRWRP